MGIHRSPVFDRDDMGLEQDRSGIFAGGGISNDFRFMQRGDGKCSCIRLPEIETQVRDDGGRIQDAPTPTRSDAALAGLAPWRRRGVGPGFCSDSTVKPSPIPEPDSGPPT